MFINEKGKYSQGIVAPGNEAAKVRADIAAKLRTLVDPQNGASAIKGVYQTQQVYKGPYKENAPDLIIGYQCGYRVGWETAIGKTTANLFHDNVKAWSGDHCIDPSLVPGILFCNRPIDAEITRLLDIGPTVIDLFGIEVPEYMDGKVWKVGEKESRVEGQESRAGEPVASSAS
jgi:predicted AlkP superfamily phosphohydrolase/phosphomutase